MITALAERGGIIEDVEVVYSRERERLPNLTFQERDVSLSYINKIIGYDLDDSAVMEALGRMRMDSSVHGDRVQVKIPAYRMDILHDVDIVEDVAIGYGYDRFESTTPQLMTVGRELPLTTLLRTIRDLMVGLGYQEVHNYVLTNTRVLFEKMNRPMKEVVEIANPKSMEYHVARNALLPGLFAFLGENSAQELPHNVFEVGDVVILDADAETCTSSIPHLAAASVNSRVDITVLKAELMTLLGNLGLSATVRKTSNVSFIKGRVANLIIEGVRVGILGEIHPVVLKNYGIEAPCVAFELEILADWII